MTNDDISSIIGYIAGGLVIISNLFQIITMAKNRNVNGLSIIFLGTFLVVSTLYIISGFINDIMFLYIPNIVCMIGQIIMISLYVYYSRRNTLPAPKLEQDDETLI